MWGSLRWAAGGKPLALRPGARGFYAGRLGTPMLVGRDADGLRHVEYVPFIWPPSPLRIVYDPATTTPAEMRSLARRMAEEIRASIVRQAEAIEQEAARNGW